MIGNNYFGTLKAVLPTSGAIICGKLKKIPSNDYRNKKSASEANQPQKMFKLQFYYSLLVSISLITAWLDPKPPCDFDPVISSFGSTAWTLKRFRPTSPPKRMERRRLGLYCSFLLTATQEIASFSNNLKSSYNCIKPITDRRHLNCS